MASKRFVVHPGDGMTTQEELIKAFEVLIGAHVDPQTSATGFFRGEFSVEEAEERRALEALARARIQVFPAN